MVNDKKNDGHPQRLRLSAILTALCEEAACPDPAGADAAAAPSPEPAADAPTAKDPASESQSPRSRRRGRKPHVASPLTIGQILQRTSHAGFAFLLAFLALISIPFFGLSTPFGLAIALIALQMIVGRTRPWLPRHVRERKVSVATLNWISVKLARWTAGLEKIIRPRFIGLTRGPFWVLCGLTILLQGLGLALPLPIPGSNWIFIFPVLGYAIGLLEDDGLMIMFCHTITAIQIGVGFLAWDVVWKALTTLFN